MAQMNHETLVADEPESPYNHDLMMEQSEILKKERKWYQDTIFSDNKKDILKTVSLLN